MRFDRRSFRLAAVLCLNLLMLQLPVYMDYHATTPCDPGVLEAMMPYFSRQFDIPSSRSHAFGREIAISSGSACHSASPEPSHVLKAMGQDEESAFRAVRFSLGKYNTEEEVNFVIDRVKNSLKETSVELEKLKIAFKIFQFSNLSNCYIEK
jgi:cysteine sulfinate desulfinase/cysteine desulfurase-like protein